MYKNKLSLVLFSLLCFACNDDNENYVWKTRTVHVSAYNSVEWQTDEEPSVAAWGDTLLPGMKTVAVSQDLLGLGLKQGTKLKIKGLDGIYVVKDKMNSRWLNKIDVFMGNDIEKARNWGVKKIKIQYQVKRKKDNSTNE